MYINVFKKINNIKFPKILFLDNYYLIFGIKTININNLNKFIICLYKFDLDFNLIIDKKINILCDDYTSLLIWDITIYDEEYIFLIEHKSVSENEHKNKYYKYYINKNNLEDFIISKIENIDLYNHLIFKIDNNIILSSKIEKDEENPDYYWGKYLFLFYNSNNHYQPNFDSIVSYQKDKGHLLHYIEKKNDEYFIIFSIRHKNNENNYTYNIYTALSRDLINFYNTQNIKINNNITNSKWYCYPEILKINNKYYIFINQDDFGKEKETLIGELFYNN